jgi:hypothetical protein
MINGLLTLQFLEVIKREWSKYWRKEGPHENSIAITSIGISYLKWFRRFKNSPNLVLQEWMEHILAHCILHELDSPLLFQSQKGPQVPSPRLLCWGVCERQKLFCKAVSSSWIRQPGRRGTDKRYILRHEGEPCLPWIKRTRGEDLGRSGELTEWNLHLQADSSDTDPEWANRDIQWLFKRQWQEKDKYHWTQNTSYQGWLHLSERVN